MANRDRDKQMTVEQLIAALASGDLLGAIAGDPQATNVIDPFAQMRQPSLGAGQGLNAGLGFAPSASGGIPHINLGGSPFDMGPAHRAQNVTASAALVANLLDTFATRKRVEAAKRKAASAGGTGE